MLHAGVDDRNAGACTGDAAGPNLVRAGLRGGTVHVGLVALVLGGVGLILGLQDHGLDAVKRADGIELAIGNTCGDDVGSQGDVPHHIQLVTAQDLVGDPLGHRVLLCLELGTIVHCVGVVRNVTGGEALVQRGGLVQNDRDTDDFVVCMRRLPGEIHTGPDMGTTLGGFDLLPGDLRLVFIVHSEAREGKGEQNGDRQEHRKKTFPCVLHDIFLLCR